MDSAKLPATRKRGGFVAVVSVTTLDPSKPQDLSCILRKGDHPFIRHDSVVAFDKAQVLFAVGIIAKLQSGVFNRKEEMSADVFGRVLEAAKASRRMHPRIKSIQRADKLRLEAC